MSIRATEVIGNIFRREKCSFDEFIWFSMLMQAIFDLSDNDPQIKADARKWLNSLQTPELKRVVNQLKNCKKNYERRQKYRERK